MSDSVVRLDVREDLAQGREPFSKIMQTAADLRQGDKLLLIVPFKPTPLFAVMAQRGFRHEARPTPEGDWEVLFAPNDEPASTEATVFHPPSFCPAKRQTIKIDACGFEPPQPMVMILEAVAQLDGTTELQARTDRKPIHLYDELLRRGYSGQTDEQEDGSFLTVIRKR